MLWIGIAVVAVIALFLLYRSGAFGEPEQVTTGAKPEAKTSTTPAAETAAAPSPPPAAAKRSETADEEEAPTSAAPEDTRKDVNANTPVRTPEPEPEEPPPSEIDTPDTADALEDPSGPVALILVTAVGRTDPGRRHAHNEDRYVVLDSHHLFVIADGMGGHAAGEVASQLAVDTIAQTYKDGTDGAINRSAELRDAIQAANKAIFTQARSNSAQSGMGTTIVAARFSPNKRRVYIASVGDSRCYRIRDGEMSQLTQDHTLGAYGIKGPTAGRLTRAVGIEDVVEVDVVTDEPHVGDLYVLCCDGLWKMVPEPMMLGLAMETPDLDQLSQLLVDKANERGGRDNITVIVVKVDHPHTA